jgi:hypothetical protein
MSAQDERQDARGTSAALGIRRQASADKAAAFRFRLFRPIPSVCIGSESRPTPILSPGIAYNGAYHGQNPPTHGLPRIAWVEII